MIRPDPLYSERDRKYMQGIPDHEPLAHLKREENRKCGGCGQMKPLSELRQVQFVGRLPSYVCETGKCWNHLKRLNERGRS